LNKLTKNKATIPLEKYEMILNKLNEEQKEHYQIFQKYEQLKKENESLKQMMLDKSKDTTTNRNNDNVNQNNISLIDKNQSKFIDDMPEMNDFFLEVNF
jgi:hypothetical protein